jgi:H+/Cl- antiporter ClcA
LGSALSFFVPVSFQLLGAVGFAAVFAGASNAPLTCSVMAIEIFGWSVAPYVLIACYASYFFRGKKEFIAQKIGVSLKSYKSLSNGHKFRAHCF